ncbi:MAG: CRTAC1 family protein, partial [Verrucomicrobiia bacterium]
ALVSGAVWTDLTGDGWPELVLACEWGPLVILRNDKGKLSRWDAPVAIASRASMQNPQLKFADGKAVLCGVVLTNLGQLTGWWNGVCAGDFDNDGRLDLLASNWGQNTRYERWRSAPLRVHFGDFDKDGTIELFETHFVPELKQFCPERMLDAVMRALPQIGERFPTHHSWSTSGIDHALGEWRADAKVHEALWLESTVFLNRGSHFEVRLLPREAQFAPAFGVCVGDADADGNEDVFLSQNFFGVDLDTSRYDSGRGLWLRGDGSGNLEPVPGHDCGVTVYGEQRGAALCDFDGDGRVDLAVTQNNGQTKLYQNASAKAGLRVRIQAGQENPCGVGAVVRLRFGDEWGPAREVHGGSGYWSQDSPVLVMGCPSTPTGVQVRWPGGRVTESAVPPGAGEIRVLNDGKVETLRR